MLCQVFSSEEPGLTPAHQVFICATHVFPPLLQLWDALRELRHQDDTSFFRDFSSGDALRKKTSKPRIRAEKLDGQEDGEDEDRHRDDGTSASRKLENSSRNAMKACSRYQYLSTSHDLGGIAYVYQLEGQVTTWAGLPMSNN